MLFRYKKFIIFFSASCFLGLMLVAAGIAYWFQRPQNNSETIVLIGKGTPFSQITTYLSDQKVLNFPFIFKIMLLSTGEWRKLKAGEYFIPAHVTPSQLLHIMKSGNVILHPITLIEGETSHHLTQKLIEDPRFQGTCTVPREGSMLPETYHFPRGTERQVILNHMQQEMIRVVDQLWAQRPRDFPLENSEELVILASIVEKETSLDREKPVVAAVFLNRLKTNMMLQADPTIVYALTKGEYSLGRHLTLQDLACESPYNTYRCYGLPPTPIVNPGRQALKAVIYPRNVPYLYFVADGTGGHVFATTLEEHQQNHAKWRKIRDGKKENPFEKYYKCH